MVLRECTTQHYNLTHIDTVIYHYYNQKGKIEVCVEKKFKVCHYYRSLFLELKVILGSYKDSTLSNSYDL